jgi:hypothetical protein
MFNTESCRHQSYGKVPCGFTDVNVSAEVAASMFREGEVLKLEAEYLKAYSS